MAYEKLIGMHVLGDEDYARYREGMTPLLLAAGGGFRYDFVVSKTLKSEATHPINRVFAIWFPDKDASDKFFDDPEYKKVRAQWFDGAVAAYSILAEYSR
jgi:uncharacterized protein (DUF1330 family)